MKREVFSDSFTEATASAMNEKHMSITGFNLVRDHRIVKIRHLVRALMDKKVTPDLRRKH